MVDAEAILVSPQKGKVQVLNEVGAIIWELVNGKNSAADISAEICRQFNVDQEQAESDALEFLTTLLKKGIIQLEG